MELVNLGLNDIILWPGMLIAQVAFAAMDRPAEKPYGSPGLGYRYQGQVGATGSRFELARPSFQEVR